MAHPRATIAPVIISPVPVVAIIESSISARNVGPIRSEDVASCNAHILIDDNDAVEPAPIAPIIRNIVGNACQVTATDDDEV